MGGESAQPERDRELTWRAVAVGALIGSVLAVANVYMGLKTGWGDSGNITAAILGFAILGRSRRTYSRLENNITQTVASSAAGMAFALGLVNTFPALAMMGVSVRPVLIFAWGLALGVFGLVYAIPLREPLIVEEQLPFPSGIATFEVIEALHKSGHRDSYARVRALALMAVAAMVVVWFRDGRPALVPSVLLLPLAVAGVSSTVLALGISVSPVLLGTGALIGLRNGVSILLGGGMAWAVLAPLVAAPRLAKVDYDTLAAWLIWPGVGMMTTAALTSLALDGRLLWRGVRDLGRVWIGTARARGSALGALALVAAIVVIGCVGLKLPWPAVAFGILASAVLGTVCVRSTGETDIAPITQVGQLSQLSVGATVHAGSVGSALSASVVSGAAAQASLMSWSFKTGHLLGATPRRQVQAQLVGILVGASIILPVYALLTRTYRLGSDALPAPAAMAWRAVAELQQQGLGAIPPRVVGVLVAACAVGAALALLERTRLKRFVPSPVSMSVGFIAPASYAVTIFLGALALTTIERSASSRWRGQGSTLAAGAIAGESLMGVLVAILSALHLLNR